MSQSHVFLSFSSHDTGKSFTNHLHTALLNVGIQAQETLEKSKIVLVVLSKNYVLTTCCLDELAKIFEWKEALGLVIIPIFYDVDPSQLRTQVETGSFEEAFDHERLRFDDDKVKQWRDALAQVVDLGGMVLQNRHESKFIQEIVEVVERKLNRRSLSVAAYPIGLDSRVKSINKWLQDGSSNVGIMALYGMGGIGKTTIAKTAYNLNFDRFDGSSFIASIKGASEQPNGLVRLQRQLISNILRKKINKIYNVDEGIMKIRDAISSKRVFIVLDDVDHLDQLTAVLGMRKWFYSGSKIIITTRHKSFLNAKKEVEMCEVKGFNAQESLELFSWHAFGEDHPPEGYTKLSRNVVYHCGGIPLALKVLGSSLHGRSLDIWESALKKLQAIAESDIIGKLRISYDSLLDDHDRSLFLDISCFFVGKEKEYVMMILEKCDYYAEVGIQNLVDRCLLGIDKDDKLLVHQLLQDMGREIIRQESPQPGRRSRIWSHRDSYDVLKDKSGGNEIRGLVLDLQMLKEGKSVEKEDRKKRILEKLFLMDQSYTSKRRRLDFFGNASDASSSIQHDIDFKTDAFTRMQRLRLLKLSHIQITGSYDEFEFGIFSSYVPGSVIPAWCSRKGTENSISFVVHLDPDNILQGLNICLTYGRSNARKFRYWSNEDWCTYYIKINNKTKNLKWVYSPTFVGIPEDGEDITLITHWKFGKEVENGDDVAVSIVGMSYAFQIKGFDIGLQEGKIAEATTTALSAYQLQPHAYFLSNPEYFMLRESTNGIGDWARTILYENLFEGSSKVTGSTYEGGHEEDDSSYDYPEHSDEEIEEYDDDEWLNAILHAPQ